MGNSISELKNSLLFKNEFALLVLTFRTDALNIFVKSNNVSELLVNNITLKLQFLNVGLNVYPEIPSHVVWT